MIAPLRRYLIDSSILIPYIPYIRQNRAIITRPDALPGKFISATIVAELAYGAYRANDPVDGIAKVRTLVNMLPVVEIDSDIAYDFAEVKDGLVRTNQLIPDNDIWIAVAAIAYGMTLVACDGHFNRIAPYGLSYQLW